MKKYLIIGIIVLAVILGIVIAVNANKKDFSGEAVKLSDVTYIEAKDGTKVNKSEALNKDKMLAGLKISNIELTTDANSKTRILADVENTNSYATNMKYIEITILDKAGKELTKVSGVIVPLEAGEKTQLNINVTSEYPEAYDFTITEK